MKLKNEKKNMTSSNKKMNSISTDEYRKRINMINPFCYETKKYESEKKILKEFINLSTNMYRKFEMIKWGSYDILSRYYEKIPESEKKMYNFNDFLFQKKYIFLAQLECFHQYILFINNYFSTIFSLSIKRDCRQITNIKNSVYIKSHVFLNKMKFFCTFCDNSENERIILICNESLHTIKRIEKRLKQNDKLLYLSIFYKGSAQKINFYGIHHLIYEYIETI